MNAQSALLANVEAAVESVIDPCSRTAGEPVGLVSMGLLAGIELRPGSPIQIHVSLGLTEPGCLMGHAFVPQVQGAVQERVSAEGLTAEVLVTVDPKFVWTSERMSAEVRARRARRFGSGVHPVALIARNTHGNE